MIIKRGTMPHKIPTARYSTWPSCCGAIALVGIESANGVKGVKFDDLIAAMSIRYGFSCTVFTKELLEQMHNAGVTTVPERILKSKQAYMYIRTQAEEKK